MSNDIDWLPVLQKVFEDYGTQLRKSKVTCIISLVAAALAAVIFRISGSIN